MNLCQLVARTDATELLLRRARCVQQRLDAHEPPVPADAPVVLAFGDDRDAFAAALVAVWLSGRTAIVVESALRERIQPAIDLPDTATPILHDTGSGRAFRVPQLLQEAHAADTLPPAPEQLPELPDGAVLRVHVQQDDGLRTWCEWTAEQLTAAIDELGRHLPTGPDPDDAPATFRTPGQIGSLFVDTLLPLRRGAPRPPTASAAAARATSADLPIAGAPALALDPALTATRDSLLSADGIDDVAPVRAEPGNDGQPGAVVFALAGSNAARVAGGLPGGCAFDTIPRDPNGQPQAADVFLRAGRGRRGQPVATSLEWQEVERGDDECVRRVALPADYLLYEGHFTGYPVLAGGAQLHELVLPCVRAACGDAELPALQGLDAIKFLARFLPGETVDVRVRRAGDGERATFEVRRGDTVCTTGRMTFASALPPFAEA